MMQEADFAFWKYVIAAVVVPVVGAAVTAIGYITKRFCTGVSYYAKKAWDLGERMADRHLEFVTSVKEDMSSQSACLAEINAHTEKTAALLHALGSDPAKMLTDLKATLIGELRDAIMTGNENNVDMLASMLVEMLILSGQPPITHDHAVLIIRQKIKPGGGVPAEPVKK